ncbi:MAG: PD40 domain-containing protein [Saprospiraceae bacterium]|nr:PD40 domain-containing protein [Saprospiraceae bacterium]
MKIYLYLILTIIFFGSCSVSKKQIKVDTKTKTSDSQVNYQGQNYNIENDSDLKDLKYPEEKYFKTVKQLTFKGDNAEGYWSFNDNKLVFQARNENWGDKCDQIYLMDAFKGVGSPGKKAALVSTGKGRTTCSYFLPGDSLILYASTHEGSELCPPEPQRTEGYVWGIYPDFDIYIADLKGNIKRKLTYLKGYDAEATVSPKGDKIVFTSDRTGDLELWTMNIDGSGLQQITYDLGYDGGAFFSPEGNQIIFRASRPKTPEAIKKYKDLLARNLVEPTDMELFICNADGSKLRQLTNLGNANWSPFFHPSGKKIIFSSNHKSKTGFPFHLFMINTDGTGLEQITFGHVFESFPVFSNNGKFLVFASNRNNGGTRDTNLFLAEWKE